MSIVKFLVNNRVKIYASFSKNPIILLISDKLRPIMVINT